MTDETARPLSAEEEAVTLLSAEEYAATLLDAIEELRFRRGRLSRVTAADLMPVLATLDAARASAVPALDVELLAEALSAPAVDTAWRKPYGMALDTAAAIAAEYVHLAAARLPAAPE